MAPFRESSHRLHDEPVPPLQFATYVRDNEEEIPNTKRVRVGEEEVLLSQPITDGVPSEEVEVPVSQGPTVAVLLEGEEALAPLSRFHRKEGDALSWSMTVALMMKAL
jgi:hypothetical protein